jgi:hypothetical protein
MVITTEGTTVPGTPPRSEFLKAHVYIPSSFLSENPGSHVAIATIVQLFIEHVGVPTVESWTRRALARNWPLTQPGSNGLHVPVNPATLPLIPNPAPRSSYYLFRGHAAGYVPTAPDDPPSSSQASFYDIDDIEMDDTTMSLLSAVERVAELEAEITALSGTLGVTEHEVDVLHGLVSDYEGMQADLKAEVKELRDENLRLEQELRASRSASPFYSSIYC